MKLNIVFWLKISLLNLFLVALLGTFLRLKICIELPLIQKNLLHSHSHFAFSGWITHTLIILMLYVVKNKIQLFSASKYIKLIITNLICAYGMLVSFIYQGYGAFSIGFSTISIFVFYVFAFSFYKDTRSLKSEIYLRWFKAALLFGILSSFGTFFLAYTLTSQNINFDLYLASIYFYLHFQYNGWFLFACIGLFLSLFKFNEELLKQSKRYYYLLFFATFITYVLSILWLNIPEIVYWITAGFALLQFLGWIKMQHFLKRYWKNELKDEPRLLRLILLFVAICVSLKFLLQFLLIIPELAEIVFGIRSIVIAFLHLVLLGIISLFLLYFIFGTHQKLLEIGKYIHFALLFFVVAVFINELFLFMQVFFGFKKIVLIYINELLLFAALLLFTSSALLFLFALKKRKRIL